MHIGYLADHLTHVPIVAQWIHAQWGYMNPEKTLGQRMEKLKKGATRGGIPTTIVAFYADSLAGTASLVKHDMETHRELMPWLASVYVAQEYRNQGIGSALVQQIIKEARILSVGPCTSSPLIGNHSMPASAGRKSAMMHTWVRRSLSWSSVLQTHNAYSRNRGRSQSIPARKAFAQRPDSIEH